LPTDPESFRRRIKLLGATYVMALMKNPGNPWLRTSTPEVWQEHVEYILGERVYGLRMADASSDIKPDWSTVLTYEHELRKESVRLIQYEGLDLAAAFTAARRDMEVRERCFTAPSLAGMVRATLQSGRAASSGDHGRAASSGDHSGGRGGRDFSGGKGGRDQGHRGGVRNGAKSPKGKGSAKGTKKGNWHRTTADNRPICFKYNEGLKCDEPCGRAHCCQICLAPHPMVDHGKTPS
jgi:hypothetical protein